MASSKMASRKPTRLEEKEETEDIEASIVRRARQTQEEMLEDRGYKFIKEVDYDPDTARYYRRDDSKMLVYYIGPKDKLGIKDFENFNKTAGYVGKSSSFEGDYDDIMLILPDWTEANIRNIIKGYHLFPGFQTFTYKQLLYNVTRRIDCPLVELIPIEEEKELLASLGINKTQMPSKGTKDPLVAYYGWRSKRIVKVIRYSELDCAAPFSVYYWLIR